MPTAVSNPVRNKERMALSLKAGSLLLGGMVALVPEVSLAAECHNGSTIIRDVTAYVGAALDRQQHVDVVIDGGRIQGVHQSKPGDRNGPCVTLINGSSQFLTPGLFDLHVHITKAGPEFLEQFPTIGLTSVRDMGSSIDEVNELRRRGQHGLGPIPHISSPGAMFESHKTMEKIASERTLEPWTLSRQEIGSKAEVKEAIANHKRDGADFIKIRSATDADEYRMVAEAANAAGFKVASHPPPGIQPQQLKGLRIASIEHGSYPYPIVGGDIPVDEVATAFVSQNITIVPTLVAWKSQVAGVDAVRKAVTDALNDAELLKFIPPRLAVEWSFDLSRRKPRSDESQKAWNEFYEQLITDLRALHERGVHLGAGSDIGVESVIPGLSALQELCTLETEVGVSAPELLKANTAEAADLAGLGDVTGRIEAGLSADLVLWSRDPEKSISQAIPSIMATFLRGQMYSPPENLGHLVGNACDQGGAKTSQENAP